MFYLDPGVHLHKIITLLLIQKKFNRSGIFVSCRFCGTHCHRSHFFSQSFIQHAAWRFFNHFLMISLNGTVTLPKLNDVAEFIGKNLKLNMFRLFDIFLDIHGIVSETADCFQLCYLEIFQKIFRCLRKPHAFSSASKCRFYHDRIADLICRLFCFPGIGEWSFGSRHNRDAGFYHSISGFGFVSHAFDHLCGRTDKGDPAFSAHICKFTVFRQKSKSRMNGICFCCNTGT